MGINDSDDGVVVFSSNSSNRRLSQVLSGSCTERGQVIVTHSTQIRRDSKDLADVAGEGIMNRLETFALPNITQAISGAVANNVGDNLSLCYALVCVQFAATVTIGNRSSKNVRLEVAGELSKAESGFTAIVLVAILGGLPCLCFCGGKLYYLRLSKKVADQEAALVQAAQKANASKVAWPELDIHTGGVPPPQGALPAAEHWARGGDSFWLVSEQPEVWAVKTAAVPVPESVSDALDAGYILSTPNVSELPHGVTDGASRDARSPASACTSAQESYEIEDIEDVEDTPGACGSSWREPTIWKVADHPEVWAVKTAAAPVPASVSHALDAGFILSTPNVSVSKSNGNTSFQELAPTLPLAGVARPQPARPSVPLRSLPTPTDLLRSLPSRVRTPTDTLNSLSLGSDEFTLPNMPVGPPLPPPVHHRPDNRHSISARPSPDIDNPLEALRRRYHRDVEETLATRDVIDVSWVEEEV